MEGNSYKYTIDGVNDSDVVKKSLMKELYYKWNRVFSLKFNPNIKSTIPTYATNIPFIILINDFRLIFIKNIWKNTNVIKSGRIAIAHSFAVSINIEIIYLTPPLVKR